VPANITLMVKGQNAENPVSKETYQLLAILATPIGGE
jgi:hypothetical protein